MFLLNRKTELVLMAIIGILLAQVFIQPAQGLQCYQCEKCGNSERGIIQQCSEEEKYCVWGENLLEFGNQGIRIAFRNCGDTNLTEEGIRDGFSCDEFKQLSEDPGAKQTLCHCQEDLCNKDNFPPTTTTTTPSGASSFSSQLLLLSIFVSVSASWINW